MTKRTPAREIIRSSEFKRSLKRYRKSGIEFLEELERIITFLLFDEDIPDKYRDHKLANSKDFRDCRELHIKPDLLLIYRLTPDTLELIQLGSHSDLFE
jgi:mRNA interferase YafQ